MRRLVIGDVHGEYNRMIDVLEKCGFDPKQDELYSTGNFCDRDPKPVEVLDYLYALPRFFPVVGNHDLWLLRYLQKRISYDDYRFWIDCNYGDVTQRTVYAQSDEWKRAVIDRIESAPFVRRIDDTLIVHGGIGDYVRAQMDSERFIKRPLQGLGSQRISYFVRRRDMGPQHVVQSLTLEDGGADLRLPCNRRTHVAQGAVRLR